MKLIMALPALVPRRAGAWFVVASPQACGGRVRRFGGAVVR
jgi:hypothetical protein